MSGTSVLGSVSPGISGREYKNIDRPLHGAGKAVRTFWHKWLRFWWLPVLAWVVVMSVCTAIVAQASSRDRSTARDRFTLRTTLSGKVLEQYVANEQSLALSRAQDLLSTRYVSSQHLKVLVSGLGFDSGGLFDTRGTLLVGLPSNPALVGKNFLGKLEHVRLAIDTNKPAVSQVVLSPALKTPAVGIAVPYETPYGRRIVTGIFRVQRSVLTSLLNESLDSEAGDVYLIDRHGQLIAASSPLPAAITPLGRLSPPLGKALGEGSSGVFRAAGRASFFSSAQVNKGGWHLVATVNTSSLYSPLKATESSTNLVLGGLWGAGLLAALVVGYGARSRRRGEEEIRRLTTDRNRELEETVAARTHELEQIAAELTLTSERLTRVLETAAEGVLISDSRGIVTFANGEAERLLAVDRHRLIGKPYPPPDLELRHFDGSRVPLEEWASNRAIRERRVVRGVEERVDRPDAGWAYVSVSAAPIEDPDGHVTGSVVTLTDLTQRVEIEQATHELNAELEAFAYSVSHDLRAPLRSIDGFSRVLLDRYDEKLDETGRRYLQHVRNATRDMAALIDALLKLSRVTRGEVRSERVDLSGVAWSVAEGLRKAEPERKVAFEIQPNLVVNGDPAMLHAVLENLLGNAWKFSRNLQEARIQVGSFEEDEGKVFFVGDNGAGFDMQYAGKLFTAFQRLHSEDEFEGTGVGLATVQRCIHRHGGRVWADAQVGKGATFYFTISSKGVQGE